MRLAYARRRFWALTDIKAGPTQVLFAMGSTRGLSDRWWPGSRAWRCVWISPHARYISQHVWIAKDRSRDGDRVERTISETWRRVATALAAAAAREARASWAERFYEIP
jgi:hypothetical protein